jgi:outer membrane protein OmpA-like peptidoglycan-associated protein/tetratricopeptide (TPR) repeat protein
MKRFYTGISTALLIATLSNMSAYAAPDNMDLLKAKYLYTHLAFNEAIPYYEKIAATVNDPEIYAQLGDCYRLVKNPQQAVVYYAKAVNMSGAQAITKLHYAQTLLSLQKYDDAIPWLQQYQREHPEERRVANLIKGAEQARGIYALIPEGSTKFMSFNTDGNEFGPVIRQGDLLITADTIIGGRKKTDMWTGSPFFNMYALKCDSTGNCSGEFRKLGTNLNTKFHDGPATFTGDGKDAYFTRTNFLHSLLVDHARKDVQDVVHLQIMVASGYDNVSNKFAKIKPFPFNNKNYSTAHPTISPSGNTLVFSSDMPGSEGGTDLYICKKDERGNWTSPQNLGKTINTEGEEMFPYLFDDNTLYFSSDGWPGLGGLDIYKSIWNSYSQVFSTPEHLGVPLNSASDDMSLTLLADGNSGYFASNRVGAKSGDNIYMFLRQEVYFSLAVVDEYSEAPVSGCNVTLESVPDKRSLTTGTSGTLLARVYPQSNYIVKLSRLGYETQTLDFSTISKRSNDTISKFVKLKPNTQIAYNALILDKVTKQPIDEPLVVMTKIGGDKKPDSIMVPQGGSFAGVMQTNSEYQVYAVKPNYYSDEKLISTKGIIPGSNDAIRDTIFMKKLEVGAIIKIENIYYDYNKANIREDAKPSLNRLFDLMQQNPNISIQINSHTDCRGSDAYNMRLSDARAASVVKYLIERGVEASRMRSKGYGESMPVEQCADCKKCTENQYQANRRTEFQILKM